MTSQFLPLYRNNAKSELDELGADTGTRIDYAELLRRCQLYRIAGIAELLMSADTAAFRDGLLKSAENFAAGLSRVVPADIIVSRAAPLMDALAVGHADVARRIARHLAGKVWRTDYEYRDDHFYFQCLASLALGDSAGAEQHLVEWVADCADEDAGRHALMQALLAQDSGDDVFADALDLLLSQRRSYCRAMREAEAVPLEILDTEGRIFVEGMMWVVLAHQYGFATEPDYLFVPSLVFDSVVTPPLMSGL